MSKHAFLVSPRFLLVLRNAKKHLPPYPLPVTMSLHGFLITLCKVATKTLPENGKPRKARRTRNFKREGWSQRN